MSPHSTSKRRGTWQVSCNIAKVARTLNEFNFVTEGVTKWCTNARWVKLQLQFFKTNTQVTQCTVHYKHAGNSPSQFLFLTISMSSSESIRSLTYFVKEHEATYSLFHICFHFCFETFFKMKLGAYDSSKSLDRSRDLCLQQFCLQTQHRSLICSPQPKNFCRETWTTRSTFPVCFLVWRCFLQNLVWKCCLQNVRKNLCFQHVIGLC